MNQTVARTADPAADLPPATALIELILATHHQQARSLLERAGALAPRAVTEAGPRDPRLVQVLENLRLLTDEMLAHMNREEAILFPVVRAVESDPGSGEAEVGAMLHPVVCMKREHGFIDELLGECRRLTDDYSPPPWAGATHRELLANLAAFEADTREHVRKEEAELFPLITALAPPVR